MKKILVITGFVLLFFGLESMLVDLIGSWCRPNLLLILIVFFNYYFGIRFGLYTAVLAGLMKDCISLSPLGVYILSFVLCAYASTVLKRYIYHQGSFLSLLSIFSCLLVINHIVLFFAHIMFKAVGPLHSLHFILLPEAITTLLLARVVLKFTKQCVSKFYV